jgi:flagellar hook-basal body complex protein FliE
MIDPISTQVLPQQALRLQPGQDGLSAAPLRSLEKSGLADGPQSNSPAKGGDTFSNLLGELVQAVDDKSKVAASEARKLMVGESDNIHGTMIAMQESGLAFNLLVEVRNKLVQSYQELMRMPV